MDAAAAFHEARPSGPPELHVNGIAGTPPRRTVESRSVWRSGSWAGAWARARAVTVFGLRRRADIRVARRRNRRPCPRRRAAAGYGRSPYTGMTGNLGGRWRPARTAAPTAGPAPASRLRLGCVPSQSGMAVRPQPVRDQGLDAPGPAWVARSGPRRGPDRDASGRRVPPLAG